eukprot:8173641-Pyramimonas_sp.AAC.3
MVWTLRWASRHNDVCLSCIYNLQDLLGTLPLGGGGQVDVAANAVGVAAPHVCLADGEAEVRCLEVPPHRRIRVPGHPRAVLRALPERIGCLWVPGICRLLVPLNGHGHVLGGANPEAVTPRHLVLRTNLALLAGLGVPVEGGHQVLGYA